MKRRRGFTLVELTAATVLLTVALTVTVQFLGWMIPQRRDAQRRLWATAEVGNVMERLFAEPWSALSADKAKPAELSAEAKQMLPEGELTIDFHDEAPDLKRIAIELSWRLNSGERSAPIRLVAWRTMTGEAAP